MEKKTLGIVMLLLGLCGMLVAGMEFVDGNGGIRNLVIVMIYTISGAALFFGGINILIPHHPIHGSPVRAIENERSNKS